MISDETAKAVGQIIRDDEELSHLLLASEGTHDPMKAVVEGWERYLKGELADLYNEPGGMTYEIPRGWFADVDTENEPPSSDYQWVPCLQVGHGVHSFDIWFQSKEACEEFIREEILDRGMIDECEGMK